MVAELAHCACSPISRGDDGAMSEFSPEGGAYLDFAPEYAQPILQNMKKW